MDSKHKQYWAAILSVKEQTPLSPDPHPASAAVTIDGIMFCSTILPWKGLAKKSPPWAEGKHREKTDAAIAGLLKALPKTNLVWGGDWNHSLLGNEVSGSYEGRSHLLKAIKSGC